MNTVDRPGFVGSWRVTVSFEQTPAEPALVTLASDGVLVCSPSPVLPARNADGGAIFASAGHGAWAATDPDTAVITFVGQAATGDGQPAGGVTIRGRLTLDADGQSFHGDGVRTIVAPAGMTVAADPATVRGTRIIAEAPAALGGLAGATGRA